MPWIHSVPPVAGRFMRDATQQPVHHLGENFAQISVGGPGAVIWFVTVARLRVRVPCPGWGEGGKPVPDSAGTMIEGIAMSVEPSSTSERPEEGDQHDLVSGAEQAASADDIQHQASRIIDAVLDDTAPDHRQARELLRQQIAAHPGHPERALMEHLLALKASSGLDEGTPDAGGQIQPEFASGE